jgi:hypothetical protein
MTELLALAHTDALMTVTLGCAMLTLLLLTLAAFSASLNKK